MRCNPPLPESTADPHQENQEAKRLGCITCRDDKPRSQPACIVDTVQDGQVRVEEREDAELIIGGPSRHCEGYTSRKLGSTTTEPPKLRSEHKHLVPTCPGEVDSDPTILPWQRILLTKAAASSPRQCFRRFRLEKVREYRLKEEGNLTSRIETAVRVSSAVCRMKPASSVGVVHIVCMTSYGQGWWVVRIEALLSQRDDRAPRRSAVQAHRRGASCRHRQRRGTGQGTRLRTCRGRRACVYGVCPACAMQNVSP